ncbi:hypothetical protein ACHAW5_006414 [Stephanodiscus triporus]|uniref:J domain-containing protein n=1 Tax=Stephanodiscus triporus TaxID=2934178 RepID=A0ABD3NQA4_9STRA
MPKWQMVVSEIDVTSDDEYGSGSTDHDRENERPADNSMNNENASPSSLVVNWKYSAARACDNLNRILLDIDLLGAGIDIIPMTPRPHVGGGERREDEGRTEDEGSEENEQRDALEDSLETARKGMEANPLLAKTQTRVEVAAAVVNRFLSDKHEEEKRLIEKIEKQKKVVERILQASGRRRKGGGMEDERHIEEDEIAAEMKLKDDENCLRTERRKLLEDTNLVERIPQDDALSIEEGEMEDERRKDEREAEGRRRLAENEESESERESERERDKEREMVRDKEREAAASAAEEKKRADDERMRKQWAEEEEERKRKAAVEKETRRKVAAAVAETESRRRALKEAQDAAREELEEKHKQEKLVERILRAAANDEKAKNAFYNVLDITPTSTTAQIKKAYRKLALKLHPDKDKYTTPKSVEAFKAVLSAYDVLKDSSSRSEYDRAQSSINGVVLRGPPSLFNTIPSGTRITVQSTDKRFANLNGLQGSILGYDGVTDLYLVQVDHQCASIWSKTSALFQNVIVCLRAAKAKELGAFLVTLLAYYKDSRGGCYQVSYYHENSMMVRTAYLRPEQFIIPNGTVVQLDDGVCGMVVGWKEIVDQLSDADGSYYNIKVSHDVGVRVQMANIRL